MTKAVSFLLVGLSFLGACHRPSRADTSAFRQVSAAEQAMIDARVEKAETYRAPWRRSAVAGFPWSAPTRPPAVSMRYYARNCLLETLDALHGLFPARVWRRATTPRRT